MDTNWLDDFLAVLTEGSFSRGAQRRAITQSAFSRRIRALEEWVGTPLFDRSTHTVQLTAAGKRFQPAVSDLLVRLAAAREDAADAANDASRTLHFASTHALSFSFFPAWLRQLEEEKALLATIRLTADTMSACENLILNGRVHFLLCHHHPAAAWQVRDPAFKSTVLARDRLLPVASPLRDGHPGGADRGVLAYTPESGLGRIMSAVGGRVASGAGVPTFASHLAVALVSLAKDGRGIVWVPYTLVARDLAEGRLVRVEGMGPDVDVDIRLFRSRARQTASVEAFWNRICRHEGAASQ